jgi:hypothetical protein
VHISGGAFGERTILELKHSNHTARFDPSFKEKTAGISSYSLVSVLEESLDDGEICTFTHNS